MALLFLSHSSADNDAARRLSGRLQQQGFAAPFLDIDPENGITAGENWEKRISIELRKADAVVFLASPASVGSKWCTAEVFLARSIGKPVFPVPLTDMAPSSLLADTQWIKFSPDLENVMEQLLTALRHADLDTDGSFTWDARRPPYPGLDAFTGDDAAVFFGREQEAREVRDKLRPTLERGSGRFVALLGPSGSGKSSLISAGVLPRLARTNHFTVVPTFAPGARPIAELARSLRKAYLACDQRRDHSDLEDKLRQGPDALVAIACELTVLADSQAVLLVIDQAEELFTRAPPAERGSFFDLLDGALHEDSPVWALAGVRSDFLSPSPSDRSLADIIDDSRIIEPLSRARLPEVIERPAQRAGLEFAPGLVQRMVEDTLGGDALPLLAYTLRQLYEREPSGGLLTAADYEAIGGVIGALQQGADRVLAEFDRVGQRNLALATLLKLATLEQDGQPSGRRVRRATLSLDEDRIVSAFARARLLKLDGGGDQATVEVAHEALLRQWSPLTEALESARQSIQLRAEVERMAEEWERSGRDDSYLLRGGRLLGAVGWSRDQTGSPEDPGREFVNVSQAFAERELQAARRSQTRFRRLSGALGALLAIAIVTGAISVNASSNAKADAARARAEASVATSRQLAAAATSMSRPGQRSDLSLLLSLAALRVRDTAEAEGSLLQGLESNGDLTTTVIPNPGGAVYAITFWPVMGLVLEATATGVYDWSAGQGTPQLLLPRTTQPGVNALAAATITSRDSSDVTSGFSVAANTVLSVVYHTAASAGPDSTSLPPAAVMPTVPFTGCHGPVATMAYTGDFRLVVGCSNGTLCVLNGQTDREIGAPLQLPGRPTSLALSPDGTVIATGDANGDVGLLNIDSRKIVGSRRLNGRIARVILSSDGGTLTAITAGGQAMLWTVPGLQPLGQPLLLSGSTISAAAVSPDGQYIAVGTPDGHIGLWSYRSRWEVGPPAQLHHGSVTDLYFTANGSQLVSGALDGSLVQWDVSFADWKNDACAAAHRNLTTAEWNQFVGTALPHEALCQWRQGQWSATPDLSARGRG
jgi:WD40 repeat protein